MIARRVIGGSFVTVPALVLFVYCSCFSLAQNSRQESRDSIRYVSAQEYEAIRYARVRSHPCDSISVLHVDRVVQLVAERLELIRLNYSSVYDPVSVPEYASFLKVTNWYRLGRDSVHLAIRYNPDSFKKPPSREFARYLGAAVSNKRSWNFVSADTSFIVSYGRNYSLLFRHKPELNKGSFLHVYFTNGIVLEISTDASLQFMDRRRYGVHGDLRALILDIAHACRAEYAFDSVASVTVGAKQAQRKPATRRTDELDPMSIRTAIDLAMLFRPVNRFKQIAIGDSRRGPYRKSDVELHMFKYGAGIEIRRIVGPRREREMQASDYDKNEESRRNRIVHVDSNRVPLAQVIDSLRRMSPSGASAILCGERRTYLFYVDDEEELLVQVYDEERQRDPCDPELKSLIEEALGIILRNKSRYD